MPDIYLHFASKKIGPYRIEQTRQMVSRGTVPPETPAWHEGLADWQPVSALLASHPPSAPAFGQTTSVPGAASSSVKRGARSPSALLIVSVVCACGFLGLCIIASLAVMFVGWGASKVRGPNEPPAREITQLGIIEQTNQIANMMAHYAADHAGNYPDGATSTEVFQKLLDGNYADDASIFYVAMPGKVPADSRTLTAKNVCFDATGGVNAESAGRTPVVFTTGYLVDYTTGADVMLSPGSPALLNGVAVTYKDGVGGFYPWPVIEDPAFPPKGFIPKEFRPGTQPYRQLTP